MAVDKKSTYKPLDMAQLDSVFLGFRGEFQGLPQDVMLMELRSPLAKENEEPMTYVVLYSEFFWGVKERTFGGSPPPCPQKSTTPANYKVSCGPFFGPVQVCTTNKANSPPMHLSPSPCGNRF
jgi:hypothetical protein